MRAVQPLASLGVRLLARLGVDPLLVVVAHGLAGLAAAVLIGLGGRTELVLAAALLLLKTLLDNMDGGLARATDRVTEMGRYLDTVVDLVVNVALFVALAAHAPPLLAALAFGLLTALLSLDFNLERLYLAERTPDASSAPGGVVPIGAPRPLFRLVRGVYRLILAPQDRFVVRFDRAAFAEVAGVPFERAPVEVRLAWSDMFSTATLVNLGLSTQMTLLAALLLADRPEWYVAAVLLQGAYVLCVQLLRPLRLRAYLRLHDVA